MLVCPTTFAFRARRIRARLLDLLVSCLSLASVTGLMISVGLPAVATAQTPTTAVEPLLPPSCARLTASLRMVAGAPESETTAKITQDTGRVQAALDGCAAGQAVELGAASHGAQAFLLAPVRLPAGVTLLVDAGVTVFGSRRPEDYDLPGKDQPGTHCGESACRPLIGFASDPAQPLAAGLMGFGTVDGRAGEPLLTATGEPERRTWTSFAPEHRPALVGLADASASASLTLYKVTLTKFAGAALDLHSAVAEESRAGLTVWGVKFAGAAVLSGSRGVVLSAAAAHGATIVDSTVASAGVDLEADPSILGRVRNLGIYAGAGWMAGRDGKPIGSANGCIAELTPTPGCTARTLPGVIGELFATVPGNGLMVHTLPPAGTALTLNAVLSSPMSGLPAPTGEVSFFDGEISLGTAPLRSGLAQLTTALSAGPHHVTARFPDADSPTGSLRFGELVSDESPSETSVPASSAEPSTARPADATASTTLADPALRLTVDNDGPSAGTPVLAIAQSTSPDTLGGTVAFLFDGGSSVTVPVIGNTATVLTATLPAGIHNVTATYSGDATHMAVSLPAQIVEVHALLASFSLSATPNTPDFGVPVTFAASGLPPVASGVITITEGQTTIATMAVTGASTPSYTALGEDVTLAGGLPRTSAYPSVLGVALGLAVTNAAVKNTVGCDQMPLAILPAGIDPTQSSAPLYSLMSGSGDAYGFGKGLHEAVFSQCTAATLAWLGTPREFKVLPGDARLQVLSGSWKMHPGVWDDSLFGTAFNAGDGGTARFSISTNGAPIYLWYLMRDGVAAGSFTVAIDGVQTGTVYSTEPAATMGSQGGVGFGLLRIPAAGNQHSVDVTAVTGPLGILAVGTAPSLPPSTSVHPTVLVTDVPSSPATSADALAAYSADVQAQASLLAGDGLDVRFVATRARMTGSSAEMLNAVVPNALGQSELAGTLQAALPHFNPASYNAVSASMPVPSVTLSTLATGSHALSASYSGDASFTAVNTPVSVIVRQAASTTALSAAALVGYSGTTAVLTAQIANSTGTPATGMIGFTDGTALVGTAPVSPTGTAVLTTGQLTKGTHHFLASYSGDGNFAGSASPASSVSVRDVQPGLSLSASATTSLVLAPVTLTANLTETGATGTITFFQGSTTLGAVPVAGGAASLTTTALALGTMPVTAVYGGDSYDNTATSPALSITVNQIPTTLALSAPPASLAYGTPLTLTANLTPAAATGNVALTDTATGNALGMATLAGGTVSFTLTNLPVGPHGMTASYAGATDYLSATSPAVSTIVTPVTTATSLGAVPASLVYGNALTLSASVSPATATGTMTFTDTLGGTLATVPLTGGKASFTTGATGLLPGLHGFAAVYSGDGTDAGSNSGTQQTIVTVLPASLTLAPPPASVLIGTSVTLTAALIPATATGTIGFRDANSGPLGTATVAGGTATLIVTGLAAGPHSFSASYAGDTLDGSANSAAVTTTVNLHPATLTVAPSATSLFYGVSGTVNAVLTPASATGAITFTDSVAGTLGTVLVAGGTASLSLPRLATGIHTLTATYAGDSKDSPATSTGATLTILDDNTTTTMMLAQPSVPAGTPVIFNVRVATTLSTVPTGMVVVRSGTQFLGSATLAGGSSGQAFATLTVDSAALGLGSFGPVAAYYTGDATDSPSDSSGAPVSFTVTANATAISLTLPVSQVPVATPISLHAQVTAQSGQAGQPAGTVSFLANGAVIAMSGLDGSGYATATLASLPAGAYAISVRYAANGFWAGASTAPQSLTVTPPVAIAFSPATMQLAASGAGDTSLTVTPLSGYSGAIAAICTTPVAYIHCTMSAPSSISGAAPSAVPVHITVDANTLGEAASLDHGPGRLLRGASEVVLAVLLPWLGLGVGFGHWRGRAVGRVRRLLLLLVAALLTMAIEGCAEGGTFGEIPAGANTVTVTVTAADIAVSSNLTVTITPPAGTGK